MKHVLEIRHASFHCTSQMLHLLQIEGKSLHQPKRFQFTLLQWSGINPQSLRGIPVFPLEMTKMLKSLGPRSCKCQSIFPPLLKVSSS